MKMVSAIVASGLLFAAGEARACMAANFQDAFVHSALPTPLPADAIVAETTFGAADTQALYGPGLRARVRRMIQGDYRGDTIIVRVRHWSSCDAPFDNGLAGYLVGIPAGTENGLLVVAPIPASRFNNFRLPDGFQIRDVFGPDGRFLLPS